MELWNTHYSLYTFKTGLTNAGVWTAQPQRPSWEHLPKLCIQLSFSNQVHTVPQRLVKPANAEFWLLLFISQVISGLPNFQHGLCKKRVSVTYTKRCQRLQTRDVLRRSCSERRDRIPSKSSSGRLSQHKPAEGGARKQIRPSTNHTAMLHLIKQLQFSEWASKY